MPIHPEHPPDIEIADMPFLFSSRFDNKEVSKIPYYTIQQILHERDDLEFSVFRLLRNWPEATPSTKLWYVVVLGDPPPEPVLEDVTNTLDSGEPAPLPNEVVAMLAERRLTEIAQRPYTEIHHQPTIICRKDHNREKMKRKMQKKSRRQNRGK